MIEPEISVEPVANNSSILQTRPFGNEIIWVSGVIIFTLFVIGFIFNLTTVLVILKYRDALGNVFVWLIFSLCISDLISALISPLFWYRRTLGFDHWMLPTFFCKLYWATDITTSFATAMHIVSFAVLRLVSIKCPFLFRKITRTMVLIAIGSIWLIAISCGFVPFYIWFNDEIRDRSSNEPDARWPACTINMDWYDMYKVYQQIAYPLLLYIPLALVAILAMWTSIQVYGMRSPSSDSSNTEERQRQAVMQLILIVVSFLIGYIPFTAYEFWSTGTFHPNTEENKRVDYYFGLSEYFFLRLSECLNPVFYNLGSSKMRKSTRQFLRTCFKTPPHSVETRATLTPSRPQTIPI